MRVAVLRESALGERRVALVPEAVSRLTDLGVEVLVESGAGAETGIADYAYVDAGAEISDRSSALAADVSVHVRGATNAIDGAAHGAIHVAVFDPLWRPQTAERLAAAGISAFSLDLVPRITRAQGMDVLSSMAMISGYEATLLAASRLPQMFPMMMTAAGTMAPAKVMILGAGVAGLQAIATARRLGAVVEAYDVRPAAAEQIQSMGARAVELDLDTSDSEDASGYAREQSTDAETRQRDLLAPLIADSDVIISTAAIPGRASPLLVTEEMVAAMRDGSVVVDLAAERGGNTAVTVADEEVHVEGVTVLGPTDLASSSPRHASQMFANNVVSFLEHLVEDGAAKIDLDDEITAAMLISHDGDIVHPAVIQSLSSSSTNSS